MEELSTIHITGTTGTFLDPLQNSTKILEQIKTVR